MDIRSFYGQDLATILLTYSWVQCDIQQYCDGSIRLTGIVGEINKINVKPFLYKLSLLMKKINLKTRIPSLLNYPNANIVEHATLMMNMGAMTDDILIHMTYYLTSFDTRHLLDTIQRVQTMNHSMIAFCNTRLGYETMSAGALYPIRAMLASCIMPLNRYHYLLHAMASYFHSEERIALTRCHLTHVCA